MWNYSLFSQPNTWISVQYRPLHRYTTNYKTNIHWHWYLNRRPLFFLTDNREKRGGYSKYNNSNFKHVSLQIENLLFSCPFSPSFFLFDISVAPIYIKLSIRCNWLFQMHAAAVALSEMAAFNDSKNNSSRRANSFWTLPLFLPFLSK